MKDHAHYRSATEADAPALWEMLTYAASMVGPVEENTRAARADASLAAYVSISQSAGASASVALR